MFGLLFYAFVIYEFSCFVLNICIFLQVFSYVEKRYSTFELGTVFYTQTARKKDAHRKGDKSWFICLSDIAKELGDPREEKVFKLFIQLLILCIT